MYPEGRKQCPLKVFDISKELILELEPFYK